MSVQWSAVEKTFLITGGASGLGALYAERFLEEGAKRIAILDVAVDKGKELAAKLNISNPNKATFYQCDVGDETQLTDVFNQVVTDFGQVDVIINNAGLMVDTPSVWRTACDVNWMDPFYENTGVRILIYCLDATETPLLEGILNRTWDKKPGELFFNHANSNMITQKPESAVNALVKMFKEGANGSIWLSAKDRPAKDITDIIDSSFKKLEALIE